MYSGQNDDAICVYLKFYILASIDGSPGIRGQKWRQNQNSLIKQAQKVKFGNNLWILVRMMIQYVFT